MVLIFVSGYSWLWQQAEGCGCGFWKWYDPPICQRSKDVIPGLLRRIRHLEREVFMLSEGGEHSMISKEQTEVVQHSMSHKGIPEAVEESLDDNSDSVKTCGKEKKIVKVEV